MTMPTTTSAEQSLINDSEFLDELEQFSDAGQESPAFMRDGVARAIPLDEQRRPDRDAFEALDSGLPTDAGAPVGLAPLREQGSIEEFDAALAKLSALEERRIPLMTAAVVVLACLTAGAVTAAYVFQERLTPVTARPSATR
jgi:hypothetical protein